MRLLKFNRTVLAIATAVVLCSIALAQTTGYPYDFSTASPAQIDYVGTPNQEMSPDHWGQSATAPSGFQYPAAISNGTQTPAQQPFSTQSTQLPPMAQVIGHPDQSSNWQFPQRGDIEWSSQATGQTVAPLPGIAPENSPSFLAQANLNNVTGQFAPVSDAIPPQTLNSKPEFSNLPMAGNVGQEYSTAALPTPAQKPLDEKFPTIAKLEDSPFHSASFRTVKSESDHESDAFSDRPAPGPELLPIESMPQDINSYPETEFSNSFESVPSVPGVVEGPGENSADNDGSWAGWGDKYEANDNDFIPKTILDPSQPITTEALPPTESSSDVFGAEKTNANNHINARTNIPEIDRVDSAVSPKRNMISVEPLEPLTDHRNTPAPGLPERESIFPATKNNTNSPLRDFYGNQKQGALPGSNQGTLTVPSIPSQTPPLAGPTILPPGNTQPFSMPQSFAPQAFAPQSLEPQSFATPQNALPATAPLATYTPSANSQPAPLFNSNEARPPQGMYRPEVYSANGDPFTAPNFRRPHDPPRSSIIDPSKIGARTDLGFRPEATLRNHGMIDRGQQFDHEIKKKDSPPLSEILATGRYFGTVDTLFVKPHFQGNTGIFEQNALSTVGQPFEFNFEASPRLRLGFESKIGPGILLDYSQFDHSSQTLSFTSDGLTTGTTGVSIIGLEQAPSLTAANAGETLSARQEFELQQFGISFFKDLKFPVSRLGGNFGLQYVSINQQLDATLFDASGAEIGSLVHETDTRAFGPLVAFEYFRPIGHTQLEFVSGFGGKLLFGNRDQFVSSTQSADVTRIGADEFITVLDFSTGVQYRQMIGENRNIFARIAFVSQTWIGGGTAVSADGDFGLRGVTFGIGYNR